MSRFERRPVLAFVEGRWQRAALVGWHREGPSWTAYCWVPTGPPVFSSRFYPLPADDVRDALACLSCPAAQYDLGRRIMRSSATPPTLRPSRV